MVLNGFIVGARNGEKIIEFSKAVGLMTNES